MRRLILLVLMPALVNGPGAMTLAQEVKGPEFGLLKQVAFEQNLDAQLPLDTPLVDESGRAVKLGDYFGKKPVVLLFVYYECPMLCTLELNGLVRNLKVLSMSAGNEFEIVTVSIDPTETATLASVKKAGYIKRYNRTGAEAGWHFLTGNETSIKRLTGVVGFKYAFDPKSKQYAHPAGLMVVTPQGRLARYIYGVDFPASSLRWSLIEASAGKIGSPVDKILLMCFHYDPSTGRYNFAVMTAIRFFAVVTLMCLGTFMLVMFRRDRRKAAEWSFPETGIEPDSEAVFPSH
jgi:protein SCO1/2